MKLTQAFAESTLDEIKTALDGGAVMVYSVARPVGPEHPVERSGLLATFAFASPAFTPEASGNAYGGELPQFVANPVIATGSGTPGFARLLRADGSPLADLSVGPGDTEIKLTEVSTTANYPVTLARIQFHLPRG